MEVADDTATRIDTSHSIRTNDTRLFGCSLMNNAGTKDREYIRTYILLDLNATRR